MAGLNPHLEADPQQGIYKRPLTIPHPFREERLASIPSWKLTPGETKMVLRPEEGKDLEWGLVATGGWHLLSLPCGAALLARWPAGSTLQQASRS